MSTTCIRADRKIGNLSLTWKYTEHPSTNYYFVSPGTFKLVFGHPGDSFSPNTLERTHDTEQRHSTAQTFTVTQSFCSGLNNNDNLIPC